MDDKKQFELMAAIRAYAKQIADQEPWETRPSVAHHMYRLKITRMYELQRELDCAS